ncbi:MAG: 30S ribosomal protein S1 [Acidobacteria bacterium]|nr:MAG: 30S ribosomal protein S1 [Acidobacteriota bacterium]
METPNNEATAAAEAAPATDAAAAEQAVAETETAAAETAADSPASSAATEAETAAAAGDAAETPAAAAAEASASEETSSSAEAPASEETSSSADAEAAAAPAPAAGEPADDLELGYEDLVALYDESMRHLEEGQIVTGRVVGVTDNEVIVDVGYKSEGLIPLAEFADPSGNVEVAVGDEVEVLLEKTEDKEGHVLLSKSKAVRMRIWNEIETAYKESKIIKGRVMDRIKGGLTVDVGLRAFLPGSLVDIKPIKNLESLRGAELEFKVISLDRRRNNIVLSRKAVLEKEFAKKKAETITKLVEGARLPGVVKNITDYGVFIDLGGIDGLLHITDISWGRVSHPSEHFSVGDETEVVILKFDPETERVSLGYKQRTEDPWNLVDKKYPIGSRIRGRVVSLVDYGAFVEIEEGVEGLIHVSEMSWTKKVVNPSKILSVGDEVEAIVSELDMEQRRISLSLRQTERNPWEELADTFPVGSIIEGRVRNLTEFGAFVEITDDIDGLIHVSDMSWTKRVKHPSEVLKKGDVVKARITNIDVQNQRVSLSIKEFLPNEWDNFVQTHQVGDTVDGKVVNVTDFGLFIDIYEGLEGLAHISEIDLAGGKLENQYKVGDWVSARILRIEEDEKKVGLTMRGVPQPTPDEIPELEARARGESLDEVAEAPDAAGEAEAEPSEAKAEGETGAGAEGETEVEAEGETEVEAEAAEAEAEGEAEAAAEATAEAEASEAEAEGETEAEAAAEAEAAGAAEAEGEAGAAEAEGEGSDPEEKS